MQIDAKQLARVDTFFDDCPMLEEITQIDEFAFAVTHANVSALSKPDFQMVIEPVARTAQKIDTFLGRRYAAALYAHSTYVFMLRGWSEGP